MSKVVSTEIPWYDSAQWRPGDWYPLPVGYHMRNQSEYIIDGYDIFIQDPEAPEDILPVPGSLSHMGPFTFRLALEICENHNGRKLLD